MSAELFLAVRCEELPARFVTLAVEQLSTGLQGLLKGLDHGAVRTWATPRRIAVAIADVVPARPLVEQLVLGPAAAAAFRDGQPTQAAVGFARGKGVAVQDLVLVDGPKGQVIAARVQQGGERTVDVVAAGLAELVLGLRFPMSMRWQAGPARWSRPIHEVIALYDGQRIPAVVAGIETGTTTTGHRLSPAPFPVDGADAWVAGLRRHHVEPDRQARRARIEAELHEAAAAAGAIVKVDTTLLDEVTDLVEWPVPVLCTFDRELLDLPPRLLVESMRVHQRVFPLWQADAPDRLDHRFLAVSNHPLGRQAETADTIANGNAKVIGARFHDARFFYAEDRRKRLEEHDAALARMQWIRGGGTMQDKARRIARLARLLATDLGADGEVAERAGRLCKADLATQMVGEFPELQGHVGRLLAALDGEPAAAALAIEEHYLPRSASDALPGSPAGRALALADRLDTLAGCFATGIRLKGSSDPLGLRRAAVGLLQLVLDAGLRRPLGELFDLALGGLGDEVQTRGSLGEARDDLVEFTMTRLRALLREDHDTEVVDAVLDAGGAQDPVALQARVQALSALARTDGFGPMKVTFKRVMGLTRDHGSAAYEPSDLAHPAERALHQALEAVVPRARSQAGHLQYAAALAALSELKGPVDALFDQVMVMAEDPAVRATRLGLLRAVADEFHRIADFSLLSAE